MFARVEMDATVTQGEVVFRFPSPVSVVVLFVQRLEGEAVWHLMASEMVTVPPGDGVFSAIPISEAPPELLEMARLAEERALKQLRERGPLKIPISEIRYGVVPTGYKQEAVATALEPGEYEASVVTEQGEGGVRFRVPAA